MEKKNFNKGIGLTALGSFWWGVIGVVYFKYISFVGHIEVVLHRCIWTAFILIITTSFVTLNIMVGIDSWTHCTYGECHHRSYPGFYYIFIFDCSSREGLPAIF